MSCPKAASLKKRMSNGRHSTPNASLGIGLHFKRVPFGSGCYPSIASNSSMKPEIIDRPLSQNFGSLASRPKGASSSL